MRIAVVVPVARAGAKTQRCIRSCAMLRYEPRTIAVVTDRPLALPADAHFVNVVTGATHVTSPAEKRDLAAEAVRDVDAYAYLDDDAYPEPDWLDRIASALDRFPEAAGIGGPGLMPDDQRFWERVSAAVMESSLGSGPLRFRFWREHARFCDDFPAYDLTIRKAWLDRVGGWATDWYGGEDTALCARLADAGGFIRYEPDTAVRHYRRALVPDHAWQIQNIGRSRGCFIRAGRPRSMRLAFAGPPLLVAMAAGLVAMPFVIPGARLAAVALTAAIYAGIAAFGHPRPLPIPERLALPFGIVIHHAAYTAGLVRGLLTGTRRRTSRARSSST